MTSKLKWRSTHITAAILGAALLALTARHAVVINSRDLRTGVLAISSMAAIMVGLILLARFLSGRKQPTLYLTIGFFGSGLLLGVHAMFSSEMARTASWTQMLVEASDNASDGLISLSFIVAWLSWWSREALERRVPAVARFGIVAAVVGLTLSGSLILAADPTVSRRADLLWVAFFVTGLIGFGRKNSRRPDTLERWLILGESFSSMAR